MKILLSLIKKEIKQILRDPSSIIIAFILPLIIAMTLTMIMVGIIVVFFRIPFVGDIFLFLCQF